MRVVFFTIVLDGMPWVTMHYPMMRQLPFDWEWWVMEGVAANVKDTAWCNALSPRLSKDGTSGYLDGLSFDKRVKVVRKPMWDGKVEMVNCPLDKIQEPCLLWQIDSDEIWTVDQVCRMRRMFMQVPEKNEAMFYCRYFVGPEIIAIGENCYGNYASEWLRVWRFNPGMIFDRHEPPFLGGRGRISNPFTRMETRNANLVFDHFSWSTEAALRFKQEYYGRENDLFKNAVEGWKRLQANTQWPVKLKDFMPWVDEHAQATHF